MDASRRETRDCQTRAGRSGVRCGTVPHRQLNNVFGNEMNQELLRIVDSIARDKNIDKESIFVDIEASLLSAARKFYGEADDVACTIDRMTGEIEVRKGETLIDYREFGRIAAQTAKQVLIQKIRENERTSILDEYIEQKGQIVSGSVSRFEGGALIVNIGRSEGFLPKSEQIPGETHNTG